jgi:hypothetical protein
LGYGVKNGSLNAGMMADLPPKVTCHTGLKSY